MAPLAVIITSLGPPPLVDGEIGRAAGQTGLSDMISHDVTNHVPRIWTSHRPYSRAKADENSAVKWHGSSALMSLFTTGSQHTHGL